MTSRKSAEPTNRKAITKWKAMDVCRAQMSAITESVCGARLQSIPLPEGVEAAQVAAELGTRVVGEVEQTIMKAGIPVKQRLLIVRIGYGLLTPTLTAQQIAPAAQEIVATSRTVGLSHVKQIAPVTVDEAVEVAKKIGKTNPIPGESAKEASIKGVTRATANFQVAAYLLEAFLLQQRVMSGQVARDEDELTQSACCRALKTAFEKAWKAAPDRFHKRAWRTKDNPRRFYGKKRSRRN